MKIHSLFFRRPFYDLKSVIEFIKKHGYKPLKIHIDDNFIKVRLTVPNYNKYIYRTKVINDNLNFVFQIKK